LGGITTNIEYRFVLLYVALDKIQNRKDIPAFNFIAYTNATDKTYPSQKSGERRTNKRSAFGHQLLARSANLRFVLQYLHCHISSSVASTQELNQERLA